MDTDKLAMIRPVADPKNIILLKEGGDYPPNFAPDHRDDFTWLMVCKRVDGKYGTDQEEFAVGASQASLEERYRLAKLVTAEKVRRARDARKETS